MIENFPLYHLRKLPVEIKTVIFCVVLNITIGVSIGLYYVGNTTHFSIEGTNEHFIGSEIMDEFDIPEKYPKPLSELITTTHNHIISLTFIFIIIGGIFFFNSIITGKAKYFLIVEPFISILITFGGIWLVSFGFHFYSYIIIISGILMYLSFFIMVGSILCELPLKK